MSSIPDDIKSMSGTDEMLLEIACKYKSIFESNMDAIICADMEGKIFSWNPRAEKIFGWKSSAVLGKTVAETIVPPEFRERHLKGMQRYDATNEGQLLNKIIEISAIDHKGRQFPVELTIIPLSENGKRFFCAFIRDISERRKAQEKERKNLEQQKILSELIKAVSRVQKQEEIYELTLNGLQESLGADKASVLLFDENKVMQFVASRNLSIQYKKSVVGHSPWKADDIDVSAIFVSDVSKESSLSTLMPDIHQEGICSLGFIPLLHQQQFLGKLMVYFTAVHHYTEEEIQLLQNIANNIAFAIWEKKSEIALKESEAKYRAFFENSMDGILLTATNGDVLAANPAACEMFRMTEQEICLAGRTGLVDKDDPRLLPLLQDRSEKGEMMGELNFIRKDGSKFSAELSSSIFIDANGTEKTSMIIRDITERKKTENKIKESELKYRTLMQQAGDSILLFSGSGQLIEANQSARQLLGYSIEEYKNMLLKDLFFEEDIKKRPLRFDLLNNGESTVNRRRLRRKDGTALETEIHAKKLSDGRYLGVARDLTERIKAEEQLKASEEKYRTLVEHASDGIVISGTNGICFDANNTICTMLGYTKEELSSRNLFELVIIKKGDVPFRIAEVLAGKTVLQERNVLKKDGTILPVELNSKLLPDNKVLVIIRDITERRKIEDALRQSNERNEIVAKATSDVIWDWDLISGNVYRSRDGLKKIHGYNDNSPIKLVADWIHRIHPDDKKIMTELIEKIYNSTDQSIFSAEYRFLKRNGSYANIFDRGYIIRDEQGKPIRMIGAAQDITERKKIEEDVRRSEEQYRDLVDNITDLICTHDLNGRILSANKAAEKLIGYKFNPEDNFNIKDLLSEDTRDNFNQYIDEIQKRGHVHGLMKVKTMTGETRVWEYNNSLKTNGVDTPIVRGYARDITEKKKIEDEIKRQKEQYDDLVKNIPVGVYKFRMKPDGRMSLDYISPRLCKMIGVKEESAYSDIMNTFKVVHPDDFKGFTSLIEESYNTKQRFLWEGRAIINGQLNWVKIESTPKALNDGDVLWDGVISDITERKKTERALEESYSVLETTLESTADGILVVNAEGKIIRYNKKFSDLWNIPETILSSGDDAAAIGYVLKQLRNPEGFLARIKELYSQPDAVSFDILEFQDDRIFERYSQPHVINGKSVGRVWSFRDVTLRKKAEDAVKESEEKYRILVENAPEALVVFDLEVKKFVNVSESAVKLFKMSKEELLQTGPVELSPGYQPDGTASSESAIRHINEALAGGKPSFEWMHCDKEGNLIPCEIRLVRLPPENQKLIRGSIIDITERKKAEQALKESEEKYRTLIEQASDPIIIYSLNGHILDCNNVFMTMTGYRKEDIEKIKLTDLLFESDLKNNPLFFGGIKKGFSVHDERRIRIKDGSTIPVELNSKMMPDGNVMVIGRDITERKKAEQLLRENEEKYRTLVEQAVDAIALYDDKGKILDVNTGSVKLLGYSKKELMKMYLSDVLTEEEIKTKPISYDMLQQGESTVKQRMMRRKDGAVVQTEVRSQQLPDGRFLSVIRDLTERVKAQEQIQKEKELSDSIINSLPGLFYLIDETGKEIRWNKLKEHISGYTKEEISQMESCLELFPDDEKELVSRRIKDGFATGTTGVEAHLVTKAGEKILYYFTGIAIEYEGKKCLIGTGIDISDRKKAEQEAEKSYKAIRTLTEHLQNIREEERAHIAREIHDELGQQLTVMKMDISWINKKIAAVGDDPVKQKIKELISMLDQTVKTVRRISSELRPSLLDDLGLTAAMEWQLNEFEKRSGIKTNLNVPADDIRLPDSVKTSLFRIFQESLTNVVRHSHAKKVTVVFEQKNGNLVLSIIDDGKGFDKQKTADKKTLGILGMKERTSMIGGSYEITSKPGKGTSVVVTIPYSVIEKILK